MISTNLGLIRTRYFRPYRKGQGPVFKLCLFHVFQDHSTIGREWVGFELWMKMDQEKTLLFNSQFSPSPGLPIDSDQCVHQLMSAIVCREEDLDEEQWKKYSPVQKHFASKYAESLQLEVMNRFQDENGNFKRKR